MLKRLHPDDPAFLKRIGDRLKTVLRRLEKHDTGLLSVTFAAPEISFTGFPDEIRELFYWRKPGAQHEILGLGKEAIFTADGESRWLKLGAQFDAWRKHWFHDDPDHTGLHPLVLGGFSFVARAGCNSPLPSAQLSIPGLLLRRQGDACALTFTFTAVPDEAIYASAVMRFHHLMAAFARKIKPAPHEGNTLQRRDDAGEDQAWLERSAQAVRDIHSGRLDKVVLGRRVSFQAAQDFDPSRIMASLEQNYPSCTLFATDTTAGGIFLGASPETLVRLQDGEVYCDALAGTAWGKERATSASNRRLLADVKNGREHRLVVQAIAEALRPVCSRLEVPDAPKILHLGHLRHLWSSLHGRVKTGVHLLDLLQRVHPTPAVGGYPRQAALDWLAQQGEQREGWYTGAIGWLDTAGDGEFAVALRCALLQGKMAHLYAGAGIVAGSEPQRELDETEAKFAAMLHALRSQHA